MVHPLNELKDVKKATAEARKIRKAAAGVPVTRTELDEILAAFRDEIHDDIHTHLDECLTRELAPIRGALEIDELDAAIDGELEGQDEAGKDLDEYDPAAGELELEGR